MEDQPVSDDALSSARDLFEAGHYAGVVAVCCQALEERPRHVALLLERARAWIALDRSTQAIADLREVISIDPRCGGAHRALGRLLLHRGELEAARRALAGALELDRGDRELREQLEAVDAALVVEGALALEDALAAEGEVEERPGLAAQDPAQVRELEATLDEEAGDLEAALAREQELAERGGDLGAPRLETQPMERAATSAAGWRAPTLPIARPGEPGRGAAVVPLVRPTSGKGRAATAPMERTLGSVAPWRAPTLPVRRPAALAALADPPRSDERGGSARALRESPRLAESPPARPSEPARVASRTEPAPVSPVSSSPPPSRPVATTRAAVPAGGRSAPVSLPSSSSSSSSPPSSSSSPPRPVPAARPEVPASSRPAPASPSPVLSSPSPVLSPPSPLSPLSPPSPPSTSRPVAAAVPAGSRPAPAPASRQVPPTWHEGRVLQARGTGTGRAFDERWLAEEERRVVEEHRLAEERRAADERRLADERLAAADRRAAEELTAPARRNITRALIRRQPAAVPRVRSAGLVRAATVPLHRGRVSTAPFYGQHDGAPGARGEGALEGGAGASREVDPEGRVAEPLDAGLSAHLDRRLEAVTAGRLGEGAGRAEPALSPRPEPEPADEGGGLDGEALARLRAGTVPLPRDR